jgi:hypothetical protein
MALAEGRIERNGARPAASKKEVPEGVRRDGRSAPGEVAPIAFEPPAEDVAEEKGGEGQVVGRRVEKAEEGQDLADDFAEADIEAAEGDERDLYLVEPGSDPDNVFVFVGQDGDIPRGVPAPAEPGDEVLDFFFSGGASAPEDESTSSLPSGPSRVAPSSAVVLSRTMTSKVPGSAGEASTSCSKFRRPLSLA